MSNELWSIWIAGPDDLVAMPSKAVAEAIARNFNAVWDRYGAERDIKVHAVAHVEPWMHGKAAHTKDLREHFHEYADLVLDEDVARFKPAQPVEAADESDDFILTTLQEVATALPVLATVLTTAKLSGADIAETMLRNVHACIAALAHPRPTGDDHRKAWLAVVDTLNVVSPDWCCDGDDPIHAACEAIRQLAAPTGEQAGEVVTGEAVAEIIRGTDNEFSVSWLIEGGIDALIEGETLYILGMNCPDDGAVELYAQPRPVGVPDDRIIDLANRLVAPGPKACAVSASECHELTDFILSLAAAPAPGKGGEA